MIDRRLLDLGRCLRCAMIVGRWFLNVGCRLLRCMSFVVACCLFVCLLFDVLCHVLGLCYLQLVGCWMFVVRCVLLVCC